MHFLLVQAFIFGDESFMELKTNNDELIHHVMSSVGGFLGAYALLNRHENFGSSATSNMIIIISDILGHSFKESFIRIIALLIYVFSIATILNWNILCSVRNILFKIVIISLIGIIHKR